MIFKKRLHNIIVVIFFYIFCNIETFAQSEKELLDKVNIANTDLLKSNLYVQLFNLVYANDKIKVEQYASLILKHADLADNPLNQMMGAKALSGCYRRNRNYAKVLEYDELALKYALKTKVPNFIYWAHLDFATHYIDAEMASKALPHLEKAKVIAENDFFFNANEIKATVYNRLGWYYKSLNNYSESIEFFKKSLTLCDKLGKIEICASSKWGLSESLFATNKIQDIPSILLDAIEYFRVSKSTSSLASCLALLGQCYFQIGNYEKGLTSYIEAKELYKLKDDKPSIGMALVDIAGAYIAENKLNVAKASLQEATHVLSNTPFDYALVSLYTQWGVYYSIMKKNEIAKSYFAKADSISKSKNYMNQLVETFKYKTLLFSKDSASKTLKYITPFIKDTSKTKTFNQELLEVEAKYRVKQQRDSLTLQKQKIKIQADSLTLKNLEKLLFDKELQVKGDSIENQAKQKIIDDELIKTKTKSLTLAEQKIIIEAQKKLIAENKLESYKILLGAAILIVTLILFFAGRLKKQKNRAENLASVNEALRKQSNHIVGGALSKMQIHINKTKTANELVQAKAKLNSLIVLFNSIRITDEGDEINMKHYLDNLFATLINIYQPSIPIEFTINTNITLLKKNEAEDTQILNLNSCITELIVNSIKYAFLNTLQPKIYIELSKSIDRYTLHYADNGIGLPDHKERESGLAMIKNSFQNKDLATYNFYNNEGFNFTLNFKLVKE